MSKYDNIYFPKRLRKRVERIGKLKDIEGVTPVLTHIINRYEKNMSKDPVERKKKRGRPSKKTQWL